MAQQPLDPTNRSYQPQTGVVPGYQLPRPNGISLGPLLNNNSGSTPIRIQLSPQLPVQPNNNPIATLSQHGNPPVYKSQGVVINLTALSNRSGPTGVGLPIGNSMVQPLAVQFGSTRPVQPSGTFQSIPLNRAWANAPAFPVLTDNVAVTSLSSPTTGNNQVIFPISVSQSIQPSNGTRSFQPIEGEKMGTRSLQTHPNPEVPVMQSNPTTVSLPINHYAANTLPVSSTQPSNNVGQGTIVPATPNANGVSDLSGRITQVDSFKDSHTLMVHAPRRNLYLTVKFKGFMMPQVGDNIFASVKIVQDSTCSIGFHLEIVGRPFLQVPSDKESLLEYFMKVLPRYRVNIQKAGLIYTRVREQVDSDAQVDNFISIAAANYLKDANPLWINFLTNDNLLSYEAAATLMLNWHQNRSLRRLYCLGLTKVEIRNSRLSLDVIYDLLLDNPFRVLSLSIEKALQVFEALKRVPTQSQVRCAAVARHMVNQNNEGYTGIPRGKMIRLFADTDALLPDLQKDYGVVYDLDLYYLARPYLVETTICRMLTELMHRPPPRQYHAIFKNSTATEEQRVAVEGALNNNFAIITGKAGTGKTTSINDLINNLDSFDLRYVLTSFTGMAVQRIREVTGKLEANNICTMHQLLNRAKDFQNIDVLVVDEGTMVSSELLYMVGEALKWDFRLIMIGDKNQLRPIDYGSPFEEICRLAMVRPDLNIPVYILSKIHRTKTPDGFTDGITFNGSQIVDYMDARILNDMNDEEDRVPIECPSLAAFKNFWPVNNPNPSEIYSLINNSLLAGISIDQIVVICPFKAPGEMINKNLQRIVNGTKHSVEDKWQNQWHLDDRVVMTINQHDVGIMNGHQGKVVRVVNHEEAKGIIAMEHLERRNNPDKVYDQPLPPINDPHPGFIEVCFVGGFVHRFYTWVNEKEQAVDDNTNQEGDTDVVGTKQMELIKGRLNPAALTMYGNKNNQTVPKRLSTKLLLLAFCLTVHKMQGGEKPIVIGYLPPNNNGRGDGSFLDANLIYTLITRAKQLVYLLGHTAQYNSAIIRPPKPRCERIQVRLAENMEKKPSKCIVIKVKGEKTEFDIVVDQRMLDLASQLDMGALGLTIGADEGMEEEEFYDYD